MPDNLTHYLPAPKSITRIINRLLWLDAARIFRKAQGLSAPTKTAVSLMQPQLNQPMHSISNGIDLQRFNPNISNQAALVAGIVGVAFGVFNMIQAPKEDIKVMEALNNLRDNHIHTLQETTKRIEDTGQQRYVETSARLTRIETILEERLPAKNKN
jgi:hypothetical protein